jgi:Protein of unknown function (DUF4235)
MSKKKDGSGGHIGLTLAMAGGAFILRKLLATAWTKILGKEPPTDLTDPKVTLPEAVGWAVLTAVIVETARFGIVRASTRRSEPAVGDAESD